MADDTDNTLTLTLDSGGDVVIKLRPDLAPGHVARIKELAREGFYDGVVFHRVIPGFMAQGGDPTGTGMGGSKKPDLKAEFSKEPHVRGVCSMARSSNPNSANSQFFICFDDARFLDNQYTVWGEVIVGHGACRRAAQGRAAAHARQDRQGDGERLSWPVAPPVRRRSARRTDVEQPVVEDLHRPPRQRRAAAGEPVAVRAVDIEIEQPHEPSDRARRRNGCRA